MPTWRAIASAVARLSPVSIQTSRPSAFSCATASRDSGLSVSATAIRPAGCAVDRDVHRRRAAARQRLGRARVRPSRFTPMLAHAAPGCRAAPRGPSTTRLDALAGDRLEVLAPSGSSSPSSLRSRDDRLAQRMLGADLGRGRQPQQLRSRRARCARARSVTAGLPRVSVPVLSRTIAVDRGAPAPAPRRRGSGCRTRPPCRCRP